MKLREYQQDAVDAVKQVPHHQNPLVIAPTGSGKSLIVKAICQSLTDKQVLIVTPRKKLLTQLLSYLDGAGVMSAAFGCDDGTQHRLVIGTWQTLVKRNIVKPDIIILDECHLLPPEQESEYRSLIDDHPHAQIIGLTATPLRGNYSLLDDSFWTVCFRIEVLPLIEQGYLVPPRTIKTGQHIGDDDAKVEEITAALLPDLIASFRRQNVTNPLIFCRDIAHAEFVTDQLNDLGYPSILVHSLMSDADIEAHYFAYRTQNIALINVGLCTLGVDFPRCDAVVMLRNISSAALYLQIIGRGLRPHPNKTECLVYDFGTATERYGAITDVNFGAKIREGNAKTPLKSCPECETACHVSSVICDNCGHHFAFRTTIDSLSKDVNLLGSSIRFCRATSIDHSAAITAVHLDNNKMLYDPDAVVSVGDALLTQDITGDVVKLIAKLN